MNFQPVSIWVGELSLQRSNKTTAFGAKHVCFCEASDAGLSEGFVGSVWMDGIRPFSCIRGEKIIPSEK